MTKAVIDFKFHLNSVNFEDNSPAYLEYRRRWNDNPEKYIVDAFPIHLDLESITSCNLKCFMCFQSYNPPKYVLMDTKLFKKIIDEGAKKNLCSVKLQYRGEPLLDTRIVDMVRYVKEKGIIEVMFNTNATLLNEKVAKDLIEAGLDKIICSVDGYTKEVYESIRIGANFESVLNNIERLRNLKEKMGFKKPIIRVQMIDTAMNHHLINGYLKFWDRIADQISIGDMVDMKDDKEDATLLPDFACAQLWQRLIVLADGDVLSCCGALWQGNEKLEPLENAKDVSISAIWHSNKLNKLRDLHKRGKSHEIKMCRLCTLRKSFIKHIKHKKIDKK